MTELEESLFAVETRLAALSDALRTRDSHAMELQAGELHRALERAVDRFSGAARTGSIPSELRQRLTVAGGQVAAQREALARAMAALDRAIDVLLPRDATPTPYGAQGLPGRRMSGGMMQA
jgi:hypothetical protein